MKIQKLTKLLAIWSFGATFILVLNLKFNYSEILFLPSFSIFMFFLIYKELTRHQHISDFPKLWIKLIPWILLASVVLFYLGIGMHGASNHIAYYLQGYTLDATKYAHLYDEVLGHVTMYIGLFGLMFGGSLIQAYRPFSLKMDYSNIMILTIASALHGMGIAASMIEGQTVLIGILAASFFIPFVILHHTTKKRRFDITVKKYPFDFFIVMMMFSAILIFILYLLKFGGFPQISDWINIWGFM